MSASVSVPESTAQESPPDLNKRLRQFFTGYTFRVILQGLITIWAVITFTFFLIRLMPGNPVEVRIDLIMQQRGVSYDEALNQAASLFNFDPDAPLLQQYADFLSKLIRGDLGTSITSPGTSVISQILRFLPWTLFCVGSALLISFALGVLIGLAMAYWRGGILDNVMTVFASIIYGIPDYVIALFIIIVIGIQLKLFDPGQMRGGVDPNIPPGFTLEYIGSVITFAIAPVATYVLSSVGGWMLTMKSSTISTLGEDYINVAKARGLSEGRILTAYVGRNALLPLVTRLAISIGFVVGGSVIVEELFQYPGLGRNLLRVINQRDYTTMQGIFLVITISVVVANVLSDLMFGLLDPRVRLGGKSE
jgi:peptide/nickel transport system permease protein